MPQNDPDLELLDILSMDGLPLGLIKSRSEAHRLGLWHRTVHVWIVNIQNQLVLQKRARTKESFAGLWDISAAGHITAGDSSANGAKRELQEELGIEAGDGELEFLFTITHHYEDMSRPFIDNEISDVYLMRRRLDLSLIEIDSVEIETVRFFGIEELTEEMKRHPEEFVPHGEEYERLFAVLGYKEN